MTQVVAALIRRGGKILICRRPADKARALLWEFAGGKVEPGENGQQALMRECREELGIEVAACGVFAEVTHTYPDITVHLTLFFARILAGTPRLLEHTEMRWITPAEVRAYDFCPADEEILRKIADGIKTGENLV